MGSLEELFEVKGDGRGVVVSCNFRKFQSVGPFVVVVLVVGSFVVVVLVGHIVDLEPLSSSSGPCCAQIFVLLLVFSSYVA